MGAKNQKGTGSVGAVGTSPPAYQLRARRDAGQESGSGG